MLVDIGGGRGTVIHMRAFSAEGFFPPKKKYFYAEFKIVTGPYAENRIIDWLIEHCHSISLMLGLWHPGLLPGVLTLPSHQGGCPTPCFLKSPSSSFESYSSLQPGPIDIPE